MLKVKLLTKKIKNLFSPRKLHTGSCCEGVFIYHTKENPLRKDNRFLTGCSIHNRRRHCKARWPIRWFLQEELVDAVLYPVMPIVYQSRDLYWFLIHKFVKKYQYHIIRPEQLSPKYYYPEDRLIHGMFQVMVDYYNNRFQSIDWYNIAWNESYHGDGDQPSNVAEELTALHTWWTVDRKNRTDPWEGYPIGPEGDGPLSWLPRQKDNDRNQRLREFYHRVDAIELQYSQEDHAMMNRLVAVFQKIR